MQIDTESTALTLQSSSNFNINRSNSQNTKIHTILYSEKAPPTNTNPDSKILNFSSIGSSSNNKSTCPPNTAHIYSQYHHSQSTTFTKK